MEDIRVELAINKNLKRFTALFFALVMMFSTSFTIFADKKEKEHFDSWQAVGLRMSESFSAAVDAVEKDNFDLAFDKMNEAYFGYYEVQGFEATVMNSISKKRVNHIESLFRDIKYILKGHREGTKEEIILKIEALRVKVYKDAMVLDGVAKEEDLDSVGEAVYGDGEVPERYMSEKEAKLESDKAKENAGKPKEKVVIKPVSQEEKNATTFTTTYVLLLREGLEAILVIVAIVAYLVKTGNKHLCKKVYMGVLYAIIASIVLAFVIEIAVENSGEARELIEGWTMFIAVGLLFYVSNWILSKSSAEKWDSYIQDKVKTSIDKKSQNTLVFAAFLAVFREGAELILFYKASFAGGQNNPTYIWYGLLAGTATLIVIYLLFRYTTVKLPLKPFFLFTSILLYLMCISFMGKGVIELTEANVITGGTVIEPLKNILDVEFLQTWLNIYPRAETLIPQIMLLIASVWILIKNTMSGKKEA